MGSPPVAAVIDLWKAILPLGDGQPDRAVARADEIDRLNLALTRPQYDERTAIFVREIRPRLIDLDLGRLHALFPVGSVYPVGGGGTARRSLPFVGRNRGAAGYFFTFFPTAKEPAGEPLGRLDGRLTLQPMRLPVTARDGYRVQGEATVGMSRLTHQGIARTAEETLALLEKATGTSLWRALHEAFPKTAPFLENLVSVDASRTDIRSDPAVGSYLAFDVRFRLKVDRFRKPYPEIYNYLKGLEDLFSFQGSVRNRSGQPLARFEVESSTKTLRVRFLARDGEILPMGEDGRPLAGAPPVRFSAVRNEDFLLAIRGKVYKYGTTFTVRDYPLTLSFSVDDDRARFATAIRQAPQIVVSDDLLYVIPKDLADWFLPGQIDQDTRNFFQAVARGADGKGTRIATEFVNGSHGGSDGGSGAGDGGRESLWHGEVDGAVLDNFLVKFTLRTLGESILPDDDAATAFDRLARDLYTQVSADYKEARRRLVP